MGKDWHHALKQSLLRLICLIALSIASTVVLAEPMNLSQAKEGLVRYHNSGEYEREFASVIKEALDYLQFRVTQNERSPKPKKLALVFDIDETTLSNYADLEQLHFGGTDEAGRQRQMQAHDPALKATLTLYNYAKRHRVSVFFITARKAEEAKATEENLKKAGYKNWDGLYFKPNDYRKKSVVSFKRANRKKISEKGYDIVLNVGDQYTDIQGGYSDMSFKLPNPFYATT